MVDVEQIADYLTTHIPDRPKKPAKARKTWQKLDLGRELENTVPVPLVWKGEESLYTVNPGAHFTVVTLDAEGAWLRYEETSAMLRLEDPKWDTMFQKIRKTRKSKGSIG